MLSTTLALASLATLSTVSAFQPHHNNAIKRSPPSHSHHWSRSQLPGTASRAARFARRGNSDEPSTLSEGSLTAAEGCTQWFHVGAGDSCYSALATVSPYPGLEAFYEMNPQVNSDCFNLWAGFDYCVARSESLLRSGLFAESSRKSDTSLTSPLLQPLLHRPPPLPPPPRRLPRPPPRPSPPPSSVSLPPRPLRLLPRPPPPLRPPPPPSQPPAPTTTRRIARLMTRRRSTLRLRPLPSSRPPPLRPLPPPLLPPPTTPPPRPVSRTPTFYVSFER